MANEKREIITMEDLRNSDGLEYLDLILGSIRDATHEIKNLESAIKNFERDPEYSERTIRRYRHLMDRIDRDRSMLLAELGTEFLICNLDDEVRTYINDRLEEIDEGILEETNNGVY